MFRLMTSVLALFFIAFTAVMALGAQEAGEPDYHLQPEDILSVTVYEQPDLTTRVRITSEGKISFPLLGKIEAAGLTVSELKDKIQVLLGKDYLVNPQVQVFIEEYHVKQISVLGAVKNPGKYDMYTERETTLLEAIAMAGGFNDEAAIDDTKIIRSEDDEKRVIQIKVTDITQKGQKEKDVALKPGDIVFVSPQVDVFVTKYGIKQISVLGAVNKPGKYDMNTERETTILEAIAMAGGFNDVASENGTRIIRGEDGKKRVIQIRVTDITRKGQKEKNVVLKPGDIIFTPHLKD